MTDQEQELWAAIRYLDADEEDKEHYSAALGALLLIALVVRFSLGSRNLS